MKQAVFWIRSYLFPLIFLFLVISSSFFVFSAFATEKLSPSSSEYLGRESSQDNWSVSSFGEESPFEPGVNAETQTYQYKAKNYDTEFGTPSFKGKIWNPPLNYSSKTILPWESAKNSNRFFLPPPFQQIIVLTGNARTNPQPSSKEAFVVVGLLLFAAALSNYSELIELHNAMQNYPSWYNDYLFYYDQAGFP